MRLIAKFAMLLMFVSVAYAGNGTELLRMCENFELMRDSKQIKDFSSPEIIKSTFNGARCLGFISGVRDTMVHYDLALWGLKLDIPEKMRTCWPTIPDNDQSIKIVIKYLRDNPAELHEQDFILVWKAFNIAFKCK